jgi:hypothetical protein
MLSHGFKFCFQIPLVPLHHGGASAEVSAARSQLLLTALGTQGSSASTAVPRLTSALGKRGALKPQLLRALEGLLDGRVCFTPHATQLAAGKHDKSFITLKTPPCVTEITDTVMVTCLTYTTVALMQVQLTPLHTRRLTLASTVVP